MKAKLLKKIRNRFEVLYYWDDECKKSFFMSRNKITGKVIKTIDFIDFYKCVCLGWGVNKYFELSKLLYLRSERRRQRTLNKEFNLKNNPKTSFKLK